MLECGFRRVEDDPIATGYSAQNVWLAMVGLSEAAGDATLYVVGADGIDPVRHGLTLGRGSDRFAPRAAGHSPASRCGASDDGPRPSLEMSGANISGLIAGSTSSSCGRSAAAP